MLSNSYLSTSTYLVFLEMKTKVNSAKEYINHFPTWKKELKAVYKIFQSAEMDETIKWGIPVFCVEGKNVAGYAAFKNWISIWFYQGVFLKDKKKKLINAQEGKTKALRQWRFENLESIRSEEKLIATYLEEAIQNSKEGKEVKIERKKLVIPPELQTELSKSKTLQKKFDAFSLTDRRSFADFITDAKRATTKQTRLEKIIPMIKKGIGRNDKYK